MGFSDSYVAELWNTTEDEIYELQAKGSSSRSIK